MATMVRWDPFREIASLQSDLSRFLNSTLRESGNGGQWVPAVDVWETDDEIVYAFDLPGIPEDKIAVELEDNVLTVSGQRERTETKQDDRYYRYERHFGEFSRSVTVPKGTDESGVKADYADGVLELRVAKPEVQKPRRIQIGSGPQATIEGKSETKTS
jgi:HSP20 family protein